MEHSLRMESYENSKCLWEHFKKTIQESCDVIFFKTLNCSLSMLFCDPPTCEFISDYSLLLLLFNGNKTFNLSFICLYGKTCFCHMLLVLWPKAAWIRENFTHVTFLNPQGISCQELWIKLAITWDFSLPHLSAPFSQVP